jgi:hypothetical protein
MVIWGFFEFKPPDIVQINAEFHWVRRQFADVAHPLWYTPGKPSQSSLIGLDDGVSYCKAHKENYFNARSLLLFADLFIPQLFRSNLEPLPRETAS